MENSTKQKILILLLGGATLVFGYNMYHKRRIFRKLEKEWRKLDRGKLSDGIRNLYLSKCLEEKRNSDGSFTFVLSNKGKIKALTYQFSEMKIENRAWDKKWRAVFFDVPEKLTWGRNALRKKIKELGFYEFQKSVFIFPHECEDEIDFIVEYYGLGKYVRYGIFEYIDEDTYLKNYFNLK